MGFPKCNAARSSRSRVRSLARSPRVVRSPPGFMDRIAGTVKYSFRHYISEKGTTCRREVMTEKASGSTADQRRLEEEIAALKGDVAKLRDDIGAVADALKGIAGEFAGSARGRVNERVAEAREKVGERVGQATAAGRAAVGELEDKVSQRPITSLVTAATVGFILAKLLDLGGRR
ncbi:MAG TPA: DUF883 family protein [Sedimenticola sp.]|nr:DUF883 family protein [Sedimenticola sp.]